MAKVPSLLLEADDVALQAEHGRRAGSPAVPPWAAVHVPLGGTGLPAPPKVVPAPEQLPARCAGHFLSRVFQKLRAWFSHGRASFLTPCEPVSLARPFCPPGEAKRFPQAAWARLKGSLALCSHGWALAAGVSRRPARSLRRRASTACAGFRGCAQPVSSSLISC